MITPPLLSYSSQTELINLKDKVSVTVRITLFSCTKDKYTLSRFRFQVLFVAYREMHVHCFRGLAILIENILYKMEGVAWE